MNVQREYINHSYSMRKYQTDVERIQHWHQRMEFVYIEEGNCELEIGGEKYAGGKGDVFAIRSGEIHRLNPLSKAYTLYIGTFDTSIIYYMQNDIRFVQPYISASELERVGIAEEVYQLFESSFAEMTQEKKWKELFVQLDILQLYGLLVRYFENETFCDQRDMEKFQEFQKVLSYISEKYMEDITLKDIAEKINYSLSYTSILFSMYAGMNFKQYLDNVRINQAVKLLKNSQSPISEIAYQCGYTDIRSFNNTFKRITGMTPSYLRQQNT